jgi:hypothetical protein
MEDAMKKIVIAAALLIGAVSFSAIAQEAMTSQADDLKWGQASPAMQKGAQGVALVGDPGKEGPYVIRLKFPAGFKVAPHSHPKPGGFAQAPKGIKHFAWASQETVIQLHGMGPQNLIYVNDADDPRKK